MDFSLYRKVNPTLRSLAAEAGVSAMTVSLALRNHPSIPRTTRARLQALARERKYHPDPALAKLMRHLRQRRGLKLRANLCALTPASPYVRPHGYLERLHRSLRARAEALGFAFTLLDVGAEAISPARLRRLLRGRGVEGIILTPIREPRDLTHLLPWEEFSVVSVTPSVLQPVFHAVSPNHYDNMLCVCRSLTAAGFRRIGLALPEDRDRRVRHRWTGALAWHNLFAAAAPIPPLICPGSATSIDPGLLSAWLAQWTPDVVVTDFVERQIAERLASLGGAARPRLVAMSWPNPAADGGIDQKVEEIAAQAVDRLAGLIQNGERGIPVTPSTTMIDGAWVWRPQKHSPAASRSSAAKFL